MIGFNLPRGSGLAALAGLFLIIGCQPSSRKSEQTVPIGTTVTVSPLKYTVFETRWSEGLTTDEGPRSPKHRFLMVHVAVENTGANEVSIPQFRLVGAKGEVIEEESSGAGVRDWLGFLRTVQPGSTERGVVLFDAPQAGYKLRVAAGDDPEREQTALIDMPLQLDMGPLSPPASATPGAQ
jgi:hypothetical protein